MRRFASEARRDQRKAESGVLPYQSFVEFRSLNDEGDPLADFPYLVKLATGEERTGRTEEDGFARLENLPVGPVDIRLDV
ncbi:MAG: hypothetical protein ACYTFT_10035 [Planctomycetota bacterium]|jgi:hypothetical protein